MQAEDYGLVLEWDRAAQVWNIRVPEVPGCLSHGSLASGQAEATEQGRRALRCHLEALAAAGGAPPPVDPERPRWLVMADIFPTGMPAAAPVDLRARLAAGGWTVAAEGGGHATFRAPGGASLLTFRVDGGQPLPDGTLRRILRAAGLAAADLAPSPRPG